MTGVSVLKRSTRARVLAVAQAVATIAVLSAGDCSETSTSSNPGVVARKFDPPSGSYVSFVGDTVAMVTAVWSDGQGSITGPQEITDAEITWTSSNTNVAQLIVPPSGTFTGYRQQKGVFKVVGLGTTTITGTLTDTRIPVEGGGTLTYTATITAIAGQPVSLKWSPATVTINVGETATVTPQVLTASGTLLTTSHLQITCSDASVSKIEIDGGMQCDVPDGTESPVAFAVLPGIPVVVKGLKAGTATYTLAPDQYGSPAFLTGKSATLTVNVRTPAVVSTVAVEGVPPSTPNPNTSSVVAGATRQLKAVVKNQYGEEMNGQLVTWTSSDNTIATVNGSGLVTTIKPGNIVITARSATTTTVAGTHAIAVTEPLPEVHQIDVTPSHVSWGLGPLPTQFTAIVRGAFGVDITSQVPVTWSTSNAAVATVTNGNVTGVGTGGALITASAGGKSMSGAVSIGAVGSIQMTVALFDVQSGYPAYGATLTALSGTTVVGTGVVNQTGRGYIPGLAPGTYSVRVTLPEWSTKTVQNITVTVNNATVVPAIALDPPQQNGAGGTGDKSRE